MHSKNLRRSLSHPLVAVASSLLVLLFASCGGSSSAPPHPSGPPTITAFDPTSGGIGAEVTITGTNFSTNAADDVVKFNDVTATVWDATATSLSARVPIGATTGKITVTVNGQTATSDGDFTVSLTPTVASFTPTSGGVGTSVTITGTSFSPTAADNTVKFNNTTATVTSASADGTQLVVTVPSGATTGKITVTVAGLTGTSATNFTVLPPPTITSFNPTHAEVGITVTITGTNFSTTPANNTVKFNGTTATVTAATATTLTTVVPTGATTGKITVTVNGMTATSASDFTVDTTTTPTPTVDSFNPTSGAIGTTVTITGSNFSATLGSNTVTFAGPATATVVSASPDGTQLVVTVPPGATTGPISVTVGGKTGISSGSFTVIAAPTISSFTPKAKGPGVSVTITGTNFDPTPANNTVTFNGTAATVTAATATTITATVPEGATTGAITVTTAGGTATSSTNFTVLTNGTFPTGINGDNWTAFNWTVVDTSATPPFVPFPGAFGDGSGSASMKTYTTLSPEGVVTFDTSTLASASPSYKYNFTSTGADVQKFTLVLRAKFDMSGLGLDIDFQMKNAAGSNLARQIVRFNNAGTVSLVTPNLGTPITIDNNWHTFWISFDYEGATAASLTTAVYVDGETTSRLTGVSTASNTSANTFIRMGDTSSSNAYACKLDWMFYSTADSYGPGQTGLTLPTGYSLTP